MIGRSCLISGIVVLCAASVSRGDLRFELPQVTTMANGSSPTTGFFDVIVRADPADLPQTVLSYNLDFQVTSASMSLGPPGQASNSLFSGVPEDFSPNAQIIRAAQDSSSDLGTSLFDGAGLVRVPFQLPAGVTGVFQLVFGMHNQLTDSAALALPLQTTDTGSISVFHLGDYNHNGTVGPEDYDVWRAQFGSTSNLDADGSGNGIIDAADYVVWRDQLSQSSGAIVSTGISTIVPEPTTIVCAIFAAILFQLTRRSRPQIA
jgi:hypothetical protein